MAATTTVKIDLRREQAELVALATRVIENKIVRRVVSDLQTRWPKDSGKSASAWRGVGTAIHNDVVYTPNITGRTYGHAMTTILEPILAASKSYVWTE